MVASRPFGIPTPLLVALSLLGLLAVHTIAYLATHGGGEHYHAAMRSGGHESYFPALVIGAVALAVTAFVTARQRARFSDGAAPGTRLSMVRQLLSVWVTVAVVSVAGYLLLENLEGIVVARRAPSLEPLERLAGLEAGGPVVLAITALTLGAFATVLVGRREYRAVLNRSYADLVASGVYTATFHQSPWAVAFVDTVVGGVLDHEDDPRPVRLLECGCGTGVWLERLAAIGRARGKTMTLAGFDLSPEMVEAARSRLAGLGIAAQLSPGDVLEASAYRFDGHERHDLVLAYDLIQQLPSDDQQGALDEMLAHVRPGGHLVVFDHDRHSRYGRVMGIKKWLRRYLGIPLVPAFYTFAAYPPLEAMRRRAAARGHDARITVEAEGRKRALVIRAR